MSAKDFLSEWVDKVLRGDPATVPPTVTTQAPAEPLTLERLLQLREELKANAPPPLRILASIHFERGSVQHLTLAGEEIVLINKADLQAPSPPWSVTPRRIFADVDVEDVDRPEKRELLIQVVDALIAQARGGEG
jgi:hypothetical protein